MWDIADEGQNVEVNKSFIGVTDSEISVQKIYWLLI